MILQDKINIKDNTQECFPKEFWFPDDFSGKLNEERQKTIQEICEWITKNVEDDILVKCGNLIRCMDANEFTEYLKNVMNKSK